MATRNIVKIDETKCNGCGICVEACAEGAIQIIDGKARLVSDTYCDGLGACLGTCPQDAITIEQREAADFDEAAAMNHAENTQKKVSPPACKFACPGVQPAQFERDSTKHQQSTGDVRSQLSHWPVQMKLVSPGAPCFKGADLLWVADCVPVAMGNFHSELLTGRAVIIGCPKLDGANDEYSDKLADILQHAQPRSLTVAHMHVPCCNGMVAIAQKALQRSNSTLTFEDITVSHHGEIVQRLQYNAQGPMA